MVVKCLIDMSIEIVNFQKNQVSQFFSKNPTKFSHWYRRPWNFIKIEDSQFFSNQKRNAPQINSKCLHWCTWPWNRSTKMIRYSRFFKRARSFFKLSIFFIKIKVSKFFSQKATKCSSNPFKMFALIYMTLK